MIVKLLSSTVIGIDSYRVDVEVDIASGLPQFATVGLPDASVKESKDRIRAAVKNSGYEFPANRVTVNLAPADIKKEGTGFDLPIAVGILAAEKIIPPERLQDYVIAGELSLDGTLKGVHGVLSSALYVRGAGLRGIIVPKENAEEAAMVKGIDVIAAEFLPDVVEFLSGRKEIAPMHVDTDGLFKQSLAYPCDFNEVQGQEQAKRALEVAAAGGHNILIL